MRWGAALVLVSCASTSANIAPSAPSAAQASFLGQTPDVTLFVRPAALRSDPYWGRIVSRALEKNHEWSALASARQIDVHIAVRDPLFLSKRSESIGWVAFVHGASEEPDPKSIPGVFFRASDGTIVASDRGSEARVREAVARDGVPRSLDAAAESLGGVAFAVTSLRFFDGKGDVVQGMTAVGYGLRGGTNGAIEGYADYASSDDAARAYTEFQRTCVEKSEKCILPPMWFRDAKAERRDRRIAVTLTFSDKLLESLSEIDR